MKTLFERLFVQFDMITHPAGGWFKNNESQRKRKSKRDSAGLTLSPESFNVRGGSKKTMSLRRTPAP
jgi:hypothetical protein